MPAYRHDVSTSALVIAYKSADATINSVARQFGMSAYGVRGRLVKAGVRIKTPSESAVIYARFHCTAAERKQRAEAANAASRQMASDPRYEKAALRRQNTLCGAYMSDAAKEMLSTLKPLGGIPEFAVGRFNVDFGFPHLQVAVEIDGGDWHRGGRIRNRDFKKEIFLRALGWLVIRVGGTADLDYLIAWLNRLNSTPIHVNEEGMVGSSIGSPIDPV